MQLTESGYRPGIWKVLRALFASLGTALNALFSGGAMPMARPDDDFPGKRPDYRP